MKYLYTVPLPEASTTNESDSLSQQLAQAGLLDGEGAVVESISQNAADLSLEGQFRWGEKISAKLATELDELAGSGLAALPLYQRDGGYGNAGYYEIESVDIEPLHPNQREVWTYTLSLTKVGTRNTHYRSIATNPVQVDNEFGNDLTALLGVDADASKVRWFDPETGARTSASPIDTRAAEFADIDVFDATAADIDTDRPTLLYELAYDRAGRADSTVWDSRDVEKVDDDGVTQWHHVFDPAHEFGGDPVLDNGLLRLAFNEGEGTTTAEQWDATNEAWTAIDLPATDWQVVDVDLTHISTMRIEAQIEFGHPDDELFALDLTLSRGANSALWIVPNGEEGTVPSGLSDHLEPIASERVVDAQESQGLVSRSEVRR